MMNWIEYLRFFIGKLLSPPIIILTITGNALILIFSLIFYFTESGKNGGLQGLFDSVWWAFSTVTTVGYGDLVPVTTAGRVISILLMLMGTGLFVAHTAVLANIFLDRKFMLFFNKKIGRMTRKESQEAALQRSEIMEEEKDIHRILVEIKNKLDHFESVLKQQKK